MKITVDTTLERVTEFIDDEGGEPLHFSTSSTPGVTIDRVMIDGKRVTDLPDGLYDRIMDALYDAGYTS